MLHTISATLKLDAGAPLGAPFEAMIVIKVSIGYYKKLQVYTERVMSTGETRYCGVKDQLYGQNTWCAVVGVRFCSGIGVQHQAFSAQ